MSCKKPHLSLRQLAEQCECGMTQISSKLRNKNDYEANQLSDSLKSRKRKRSCEFGGVNEALYNWYTLACSKNIYPSGPQLCEKAREIAEQLSVSIFKASYGWLDKWKKRHNIRQVKVSGENQEK